MQCVSVFRVGQPPEPLAFVVAPATGGDGRPYITVHVDVNHGLLAIRRAYVEHFRAFHQSAAFDAGDLLAFAASEHEQQ